MFRISFAYAVFGGVNGGLADGLDGPCTIGVGMRHTAVVVNCLKGATPRKFQ